MKSDRSIGDMSDVEMYAYDDSYKNMSHDRSKWSSYNDFDNSGISMTNDMPEPSKIIRERKIRWDKTPLDHGAY